ncbi:hypothetical protein PBY51_004824 [Eleginops maclovinus]|uniref:Uncharacterized protein n=1 Tax=Eleginops maclovinus TaxID=56733 RepID=A0AAN7X365_ELEMC|nr:hypothetical protein PBY51_004824 [Eleginops maclovinus]
MGMDSEGDMFVHSAWHTEPRLSELQGRARSSTHGLTGWGAGMQGVGSPHCLCPHVQKSLGFVPGAGRSRRIAGETIAAIGRELWDTNAGDILKPRQECPYRPKTPTQRSS